MKRRGLWAFGSEARLDREIRAIHHLSPPVKALSDTALREAFQNLAPHFSEKIDTAYLPQAFAYVREAIIRVRGLEAYDVQLRAGLVLARGELAEMATGEGKTLVAVFPAAVFALAGRGVHLATVNAYLAERDCETMAPIFESLGLSVALLRDKGSPDEKRKAYRADVTYGTGYEFGFDYLRDQIALLQLEARPLGAGFREAIAPAAIRRTKPYETIQRELAYAIIDEVDSVLIDEAITPLVLSKGLPPGENPGSAIYRRAEDLVHQLEEGSDFIIDRKLNRVRLTPEGLERVYQERPDDQADFMKRAWHEYIEQALRARFFYLKNVHYLIREDAIELIDENTGRSFSERRWQGGLHQAIEAKETLTVSHETESDVTISRQRFYQLYPTICGMTGTAWEARAEITATYGVAVRVIPRNRPKQAETLRPRIFASREAKHRAIAETTRAAVAEGRPVLIGTRNVRQSEALAEILNEFGIHSTRLNAKQDAEEAEVIARAGLSGRVTLATNMAGRGADIPLGEGVAALGGLFVIAEERNDSSRVDRQLAGRAGRQGAPGAVQFFMSLEDELFARADFAIDPTLEGELGEAYVKKADHLQRRVEATHAKVRSDLTRKDRMMDRMRRHS